MTRRIDTEKLKRAAEHLDWVLGQYPDSVEVKNLHAGLRELINCAKAERIDAPFERAQIPGAYLFAEGIYREFRDPDVEGAYVGFSVQLRGGLTDAEVRITEQIRAMQADARRRG